MVVGEVGLLGGIFVDGKAGVVGCKLMFSSSQVVYVSDMGLAFEVLTRAVDLGPRLLRVGTGIDVNKVGSRHVGCWSYGCFGHPEQGLSEYMYSHSRTQLTNGQMASWLEMAEARDAGQSEEQRADGGKEGMYVMQACVMQAWRGHEASRKKLRRPCCDL